VTKLEVFNPVARSAEVHVDPAPRLATINDKRIGLYWNMKTGGNVALDQVSKLLSKRYPSATFELVVGSVGAAFRHVAANDAARVAANFDGVVGTTAD